MAWLFDLSADPFETENFFDNPRYRAVRDSLLEELREEMDDFQFPIFVESKYIFWSTPACFDSRDRIRIDNENYTCEDLGDRLPMEKCSTDQDVKNHCPISCNSCCEDSAGEMWVDGVTLGCDQLANECDRPKVRKFCPR